MKFKLLLVATIVAIGQIHHVAANAESTQIERLVSEDKLATSLSKTPATIDRLPLATAKDLLAQSSQKTRKLAQRKPLRPSPPAKPSPPTQTPTATPAKNQKQVLVSDIIIRTPAGALAPELESKVRQILTVKTGQPTTREQLEQNLNAVRALGAFAAVEIIPEDTAKGVKLSFLVTPYGTLRQVQIKTLPASSSTILKQTDVDSIFGTQYGKQLNAV